MESAVERVRAGGLGAPHHDQPVAARAVERSLANRWSAYAEEVGRLIRAGLAVMQRDGTSDPRVSEVVAESGLSNQAFYRHFRSKEELLLAISDDGLRQLVAYLEHQMAKEDSVVGKVRRWVEGLMAQAAEPEAASATRAVVLNSSRLRQAFPDEAVRSEERIKELLLFALRAAGGNGGGRAGSERDAEVAYRAAMGSMQAWLLRPEPPSRKDVEHLVGFVLRGLGLAGQGR